MMIDYVDIIKSFVTIYLDYSKQWNFQTYSNYLVAFEIR